MSVLIIAGVFAVTTVVLGWMIGVALSVLFAVSLFLLTDK